MTETGHVVATPARKHDCEPGWTTKTGTDGRLYSVPPWASDYPKGTVWECPCGRTWVSRGAQVPGRSLFAWWRREGRLARWRRTRKAG